MLSSELLCWGLSAKSNQFSFETGGGVASGLNMRVKSPGPDLGVGAEDISGLTAGAGVVGSPLNIRVNSPGSDFVGGAENI